MPEDFNMTCMPPRRSSKTALIIPLVGVLTACTTAPAAYSPPEISPTGTSLSQLSADADAAARAGPLSTNDLSMIAVLGNPDLQAMRAEAGLADAQIFAAGLLPDPTIGLGFDAPLNGANEVLAIAGSLGLDLAGLSSRPARGEAAKAQAAKVRKDIVWAEWLTHQNAKLLASRISWLGDIRNKTVEYRKVADEDLERTLRAASRGDVAAVEVDARRLTAADAADRDRTAENQLAIARLDLNRLLGIAPGETVLVQPHETYSAVPPSTVDLFAHAIAVRADMQGLRDGLEAASAGVAVADASRFPLPAISLNAARDTGNIRTLGPAVSFTLPIWNRARGDIAVAKADLGVLEAQYKARAEMVRADIGAAASALSIARKQRADVVDGLAGIADQADRAAASADRGDISETTAAATRLAALDKEILADTLALAAVEAAVALETAVGAPLDSIE